MGRVYAKIKGNIFINCLEEEDKFELNNHIDTIKN